MSRQGCSLCCPEPQETDEQREARERTEEIDEEIMTRRDEMRREVHLLLLGCGESGKSTFLKQMRIIHDKPFSAEELSSYRRSIYKNIRTAFQILSQEVENAVIPLNGIGDSLDKFRRHYSADGDDDDETDALTPEFFNCVEQLWQSDPFQAVFRRTNVYEMIEYIGYFMNPSNFQRIRHPHYVPEDTDLVWCRAATTSIAKVSLLLEGVTFDIFDVGGQRGERKKWILCFNNATAIMFLVACNEYDVRLAEDSTKNRLKESLEIFEKVWNNRWLTRVSIILFLNKIDLLEKKVNEGTSRIEDHFPDYADYQAPRQMCEKDTAEFHKAKHWIKDKFLNITRPDPSRPHSTARHKYHHCFEHFTCAVDRENIKRVFEACRSTIIVKELMRFNFA